MNTTADSGFIVKQLDAHFVMRIFMALLVMVILSAAILVGGRFFGRTLALGGHSDSTKLAEIVIGNNVLHVPANALRLEEQRAGGEHSRVEIYLHWPDMNGYSRETADAFNHANGSSEIIFMTLERSIMSRDMSGRVGPIYSSVIAQPGIPGPAGTTMFGFKEQSGYLDELLVTAPRAASEPFAARCLAGEEANRSLAPCERDIHVGDNLSLTYRFPKELLAEWQKLDASVLAAATSYLQTAR